MRQYALSNVISDLRQAKTSTSRNALLQHLKNDLIGHYLRKQKSVREGIIPLLSELLATPDSAPWVQGEHYSHPTAQDGSTYVHTTAIVTVLANGGPEFVVDILDSDIVANLLETLCLHTCPPQNALSVLKCLNTIANNLPPSEPSWWREDKRLADLLYQTPFVACFQRLVSQAYASVIAEALCSEVLQLVSKTCTDEKEKRAMGGAEVISVLATRLASFIVADGYVFPNLDTSDPSPLPPAAPPFAQLFLTLQVMAMLTEQSRIRAKRVLLSPAILITMPKWQGDFHVMDYRPLQWAAYHGSLGFDKSKLENPLDALLPTVPQSQASLTAEQANFPPLSIVMAIPKRRPSIMPSQNSSKPGNLLASDKPEEEESPIVGWLIHVLRTKDEPCRLMAAKFLVSLLRLGLIRKSRMRMLGMVLVPQLVVMLEDGQAHRSQKRKTGSSSLDEVATVIQIPEILASLIMDDEELQTAAVDAGSIKLLTQAFKSTFDLPRDVTTTMWNPDISVVPSTDLSTQVPGRIKTAPTSSLRQNMVYREGLLKALAAIAPFNDDYRKAICDHGILPCLIDSLKAITSNDIEQSYHAGSSPGNPAATLLAACCVAQALTRSVSALRTNLIDAGIAPPVLELLSNDDPEVKIAATRVVGNLAMDFSPMKESMSRQTVIRSLCQQAHSANPRLRFESIWALKQLVLNSPNAIKINVIQELGPSWIKQLISTDPLDIPPGIVIGLVDMTFPPRTHFLGDLTAQNDDVVMSEVWSADPKLQDSQEGGQNPVPEDDPNRHTVQDDTAIQEQLLDFIRNLFCGEKASEIIDYVFSEMDQTEFFDIMLARLRYRTVHGSTRKENKSVAPPSGIIVKVLYILVHIAASRSRFRSLISSNSVLLRHILAHCGHTSPEIRAQISWIAINLTYLDNKAEETACKHRAIELQKAGYYSKLTTMLDDVDMDVRERTKTAVHLLRLYLS